MKKIIKETIKVDFFRVKNFWLARVYGGQAKGDYLKPSLDECYSFVDKLNEIGK